MALALRQAGMRLAAYMLVAAFGLLFAVAALADGDRATAQAELDRVAARIETLKADRAAGKPTPDLDPLLVRAQELASELEAMDRARAKPPAAVPVPAGPDAEELRERADLAKDRADKVARALDDVDARLDEAKRQRELSRRMDELTDEGALFDESGTGRLVVGRGGGAQTAADRTVGGPTPTGTGAPTTGAGGPPGGGGPGGGGASNSPSGPGTIDSPQSSSFGGGASASASGGSSLTATPLAAGGALAGLAPAPGDSEKTLARKKGELEKALAALRSEAAALEAQAQQAAQKR